MKSDIEEVKELLLKKDQERDEFVAGDKQLLAHFERVRRSLRRNLLCIRIVKRDGGASEEQRVEFLHDRILLPKLGLYGRIRKLCVVDIEFREHVESETEKVVFMKKSISGWCTEIDPEEFDALCKGTDGSFENLIALVVRGRELFRKEVYGCDENLRGRVSVIFQGFDDAQRQAKREKAEKMKFDSEEKARLFCSSVSSEIHSKRRMKMHFREQIDLSDLCIDELENDFCESVRSAAMKNAKAIGHSFSRALEAEDFEAKIAFWKGLFEGKSASQVILTRLFGACLAQKKGKIDETYFQSAIDLGDHYLRANEELSAAKVAQKLVFFEAGKSASSGFLTGFGGFTTMYFTIPAGLFAAWATAARLSFAVAHIFGHDVFHPVVVNAVLFCLTGAKDMDENLLKGKLGAVRNGTKMADDREQLQRVHVKREEHIHECKTLYDLLEISQDASIAEIRLAFRQKALRCHPDKVQDNVEDATRNFQILAAAYEILGDEKRRTNYDEELNRGDWSWDKLDWKRSLDKARDVFTTASSQIKAFADHETIRKHAAGRAAAQVIFSTATAVGARAGTQAGAQVSLRVAYRVELQASINAGERLAAQTTARSGSRLIPLVGAIISAAIDSGTTASCGHCALRIFHTTAQTKT